MSIGSRIKEKREALGISQVEFARLIGVTKGAVGNYEAGTNSPKASILYRIFDVLHCDANYLYQDEIPIYAPTQNENTLLMLFGQLNEEGQEKLIDSADDLVRSGKYKKISSASRGSETGTGR